MTRTRLCSSAEWFHLGDTMSDEIMQKYEARLRELKGDDYLTMGDVVGFTLEPHTEPGEGYPSLEDIDLEELTLGVAVETDDGRRIMTEIPSPSSGWDLTSDLVVLLEYLDLEPEDLHTLKNGDYQVPVSFSSDDLTYYVDFDEMRGELLDDD